MGVVGCSLTKKAHCEKEAKGSYTCGLSSKTYAPGRNTKCVITKRGQRQPWQCMPVTLVLGKQRQQNRSEFILGYITIWKPAYATLS